MAKTKKTDDGGTPGTLDLDTGAEAVFGLLSDDLDTEQVEDESETSDGQDDEFEDDADLEDDDDSEDVEIDEDGDEPAEDVDNEDDDSETDDPWQQTRTVKVDGEEIEVTPEEALAGYMRQQAFTRKTQRLAEDRGKISQAVVELTQTRQDYLDRLAAVEAILHEGLPAEPDWAALKKSDPVKYAETRAAYQDRKDKLDAVRAEIERAHTEAEETARGEFQRILELEMERLEAALPEWADPEVRSTEQKKLVATAVSTYGFTEDEVKGVVDHRAILILRDAMRYRELQERGSEARDVVRKSRKRSATLQPGNVTRGRNAKQRKPNPARKRLAQSGRVDDAAAALFDLLE